MKLKKLLTGFVAAAVAVSTMAISAFAATTVTLDTECKAAWSMAGIIKLDSFQEFIDMYAENGEYPYIKVVLDVEAANVADDASYIFKPLVADSWGVIKGITSDTATVKPDGFMQVRKDQTQVEFVLPNTFLEEQWNSQLGFQVSNVIIKGAELSAVDGPQGEMKTITDAETVQYCNYLEQFAPADAEDATTEEEAPAEDAEAEEEAPAEDAEAEEEVEEDAAEEEAEEEAEEDDAALETEVEIGDGSFAGTKYLVNNEVGKATLFITSEEGKREPNLSADASIDQTSIYGVTFYVDFVDEEVADEATWIGGGIGANSNSTGWLQKEWGRTEKEFIADLENGTITMFGDAPIFAADDTYCQLWLQTWGGTVTVNDADLLDADGNIIAIDLAVEEDTEEDAAVEEAPEVEEDEAPATGDVDASTDSSKGSPDTGVEDVAVVAGLAIVAAGAVLVSKKRK